MHEHTRISKSLNSIVNRLDNICSLTESILENNKNLTAYLKTTLKEQQVPETWMIQKEVAAMLGVSRQSVRNWEESGKLMPTKVGGRKSYALSEVIRRREELSPIK